MTVQVVVPAHDGTPPGDIALADFSNVDQATGRTALGLDSERDLSLQGSAGTLDWGPIIRAAAVDQANPISRFYRKTIFLPGYNYPVLQTIALDLFDGFDIRLARNAAIVADAALEGKIFQFTNSGKVLFRGGIIDTSAMAKADTLGGQAWDSLSFERNTAPAFTTDITIDGVTFIHGTGEAGAHGGGDSSIFLAATHRARVTNCTFIGSPDAAIYLSGDGVVDHSSYAFDINGNFFQGCYSACEGKRTVEHVNFTNNIVRDSGEGGGFACSPGSPTGTGQLPGKGVICSDNQFTNTLGDAISIRGFGGNVIEGNRIEGFTDVTTFLQRGIALAGSKRNKVRGNYFIATSGGTGHSTQVGIELQSYTLNAVVTHSTENDIGDNTIIGLENGIREVNSNQDYNNFRGNTFYDCTTGYTINGANSTIAWGIAEGGTGASTAADARNNLAVGGLATTNVWTGPNSFNARVALGSYIRPGFDTVANIVAIVGPGTGARMTATDSTVAASGNFGAIVAGGGSNVVPVWFDNTNWRIG